MRMFAALLFVAISARAQLRVGPEIPLAAGRHTNVHWQTPIAVAPARDGFVVAWSQRLVDGRFRVEVAKADEGGAVVRGPLEMLPSSPSSRYAADPSIAAFGDGFLIAWTEDAASWLRPATPCAGLDASLNVTVPEYQPLPGGAAAAVRAFGDHAIVAIENQS